MAVESETLRSVNILCTFITLDGLLSGCLEGKTLIWRLNKVFPTKIICDEVDTFA